MALITVGTGLDEAVAQADLDIEAMYEDIEVKKEVFKKMDKASPKETILASNTLTLSPAGKTGQSWPPGTKNRLRGIRRLGGLHLRSIMR